MLSSAPRCTAQCSAEVPSASASFGFAPAAKALRNSSAVPCLAAASNETWSAAAAPNARPQSSTRLERTLRIRKIQTSRAVADRFDVHVDAVEQRQQQVRQRRAARLDVVLPTAGPPGGPADERQRQVDVRVQVRVAECAAVQEQGVV